VPSQFSATQAILAAGRWVNLMRVQSSEVSSSGNITDSPAPLLLIQILRVAAKLVQTVRNPQKSYPPATMRDTSSPQV